MIAFWVKKFLAFWLMPVTVVMVLLGVALLLARKGRLSAGAKICLATSLGILLLISNKTVSRLLIAPLESAHTPVAEARTPADLPTELRKVRHILVLGGGHAAAPHLPTTMQLSNSALARLTEAVRLARLLPASTLIFCGSGPTPDLTHAKALRRAAEALGGIESARTVLQESVRDTEDEIALTKALVGDGRVALVTSACHMPRAMRLCRQAGLDAFPCPTDFLGKSTGRFSLGDLGWDSESITRSTFAVREYIGAAWIRLKS